MTGMACMSACRPGSSSTVRTKLCPGTRCCGHCLLAEVGPLAAHIQVSMAYEQLQALSWVQLLQKCAMVVFAADMCSEVHSPPVQGLPGRAGHGLRSHWRLPPFLL